MRPKRRGARTGTDQLIRCATMSPRIDRPERLEVDRKHAPQAVGRDAKSKALQARRWVSVLVSRFICRAPTGGEPQVKANAERHVGCKRPAWMSRSRL